MDATSKDIVWFSNNEVVAVVYGDGGDDTIYGGPGDDYINDWSDEGGGGNNTFVWNLGDGHDRIDYYLSSHVRGDGVGVLRFGPGIAPSDVELANNGEHGIFRLIDGSGSVTFQRMNRSLGYEIDEVHFADGTMLKLRDFPRK